MPAPQLRAHTTCDRDSSRSSTSARWRGNFCQNSFHRKKILSSLASFFTLRQDDDSAGKVAILRPCTRFCFHLGADSTARLLGCDGEHPLLSYNTRTHGPRRNHQV